MDDFLRIIDWMPYIVELSFIGHELIEKREFVDIYGFPKRDNANRLDQKRLNIISKRDIIGDSGIGRLVRREKGVPLSYVGMFVDTTNQHDNHI